MTCPFCGRATEQEMVDVGVGEIPCGPPHCDWCMAVQNEDGTWEKVKPPTGRGRGE